MIKIYGMNTCPDCVSIKNQIVGKEDKYNYIDMAEHVLYLKEFLKLRDNEEAFVEAKKNGQAGIPCFVLEDGTVSLKPEDAGLVEEPRAEGASCSIEDHLNHKGGC